MAETHLARDLEAEAAYRDAWLAWKTSIGLERKRLEQEMDRLQPYIARNPADPRWQNFIDTLPGYREFWDGVADHYAGLTCEIKR